MLIFIMQFTSLQYSVNQLVSIEPEMFVPTIIIGYMAKYCNNMVSSLDENNYIKNVYRSLNIAYYICRVTSSVVQLWDFL